MKDAVQKIPGALQRVILIRLGLALLALILAGILFFCLSQMSMAVTFLLAFSLLAGHAVYISWLSIKGRCLKLKGTVLETEWSFLRDRPKALLIEAEGVALRVILHGRIKAPTAGSDVVFYIPDTAMLYEWRGMHQIDSYITLELPAPNITGHKISQ